MGSSIKQTQQIFSKLTDHQIVKLARHPLRPHSTNYICQVFDRFDPMSGDRRSGKSHAIIGGIARLNGMSVMVIAQEKDVEQTKKLHATLACLNQSATDLHCAFFT